MPVVSNRKKAAPATPHGASTVSKQSAHVTRRQPETDAVPCYLVGFAHKGIALAAQRLSPRLPGVAIGCSCLRSGVSKLCLCCAMGGGAFESQIAQYSRGHRHRLQTKHLCEKPTISI